MALEEKLLASVAENKELKAGVLSSDKAHHQEQSPSKEQGQDVKPSVRTPITSTIMSTDDNRAKHEIRKLEELVSSLRYVKWQVSIFYRRVILESKQIFNK